MKLAILLLAFIALSAFAAAKPETKMQKDQRECRAEGDGAVATAKLKHPGDVTKVKDDAYRKCMRGKSYAMPPIREK
jgi:hypothetical protein